MRLKAVVFDVFETLVANGPDLWLTSFQRLCRDQGLPVEPQALWDAWIVLEREFRHRRLDPLTLQAAETFESYEEVWTDCFDRVFRQMGLAGDPSEAARVCIQDLGRRPAFPETLGVLQALDGSIKLALLSNADRVFLDALVDHYDWKDRFEVVLSSEEARVYKPHPAIFQAVLERLGVEPAEALQVGDTFHEDVRGAKQAGMEAAWVNRHGLAPDPDLPQADYQLHSLGELPAILKART
jgi:2-haloalkanoic acid dehalogenase type II